MNTQPVACGANALTDCKKATVKILSSCNIIMMTSNIIIWHVDIIMLHVIILMLHVYLIYFACRKQKYATIITSLVFLFCYYPLLRSKCWPFTSINLMIMDRWKDKQTIHYRCSFELFKPMCADWFKVTNKEVNII